MKIIFTVLFIFTLTFSITHAQNKQAIDSLYVLVKKANHDTCKIKYLKKISGEFTYTNPDTCISILESGLKISEKYSFLQGEVMCLSGMSRANWVKGDYPQSMNLSLKALKICSQVHDNLSMIYNYNMLGLVYFEQTDYVNALSYYKKALELEIKIKDSTLLSRIMGNIGDIYFCYHDTVNALNYYKQALQISTARNDDMNSSTNYLSLGTIYREQKKDEKAEEFLTKGLMLAEKVHDNQNAARCLSALALLYYKTNQYKKVIEFGERAIKTAKEISDLPSLSQAAFTVYKSFDKQKNHKDALRYYQISVEANNKMFNTNKAREIAKLNNSLEMEKKQSEIEILSKDKKLAQLQAILFGSGFILISLLVIIVYRSRQKEYKAKILLREQKKEIEEKNEELHQQNAEIAAQRDEIEIQRDHILKQKQDITDSIEYASRIQHAVLPSTDIFSQNLTDFFILYKPRNIVSGDFYWAGKRNNWLLIAIADCTGHGVPGAFMSMLGISFLNEIISRQDVEDAGKVLDELRQYVISSLQQQGKEKEQKDGMDITFIAINTMSQLIHFAGANNSIYIVKSNNDSTNLFVNPVAELVEAKGDKMPISIFAVMKPFSNHEFQLNKGDIIYMLTDGYEDQFGGPSNKKFMIKRLKNMLLENHKKPMYIQKEIYNTTIEHWKNGYKNETEQTDDITILGIKI